MQELEADRIVEALRSFTRGASSKSTWSQLEERSLCQGRQESAINAVAGELKKQALTDDNRKNEPLTAFAQTIKAPVEPEHEGSSFIAKAKGNLIEQRTAGES